MDIARELPTSSAAIKVNQSLGANTKISWILDPLPIQSNQE